MGPEGVSAGGPHARRSNPGNREGLSWQGRAASTYTQSCHVPSTCQWGSALLHPGKLRFWGLGGPERGPGGPWAMPGGARC